MPFPVKKTLGWNDLIAGYYTLAGASAGAGVGEPAKASFEERVTAAATAGFSGIGLLSDDYVACRKAGQSDADMRRILDDHGIQVAEVEFLFHWNCNDERQAHAQLLEERLYAMADAFGPHHVNVGDVNPAGERVPLERVAESFAGVCDRAAEHDLYVALEFLPWTDIPDAATAWEIIQTAGRSNGGLNLDVWHHYRGADDEDMIRSVPADRIFAVAISDANAEIVGDLIEDTTRRRLLPGEGSFDLVRFIRLLDEMGVTAPVTVEILSDEHNARPTAEAARLAYETTRAVMTEAGLTIS